jgi:GMP synthase-like glutamine amidotransferase
MPNSCLVLKKFRNSLGNQRVCKAIAPSRRKSHPLQGIILSGSPYSVYDADAPHVDPDVFKLGIPVLGICYGLQVKGRDHL